MTTPILSAPKVLVSEEDRSVNFVFDNGQEARYVRRSEDYAIVYLSSHGGCNQACRFCHLTQTGQVEMVPATAEEFFDQARAVLMHYNGQVRSEKEWPVKFLNFNWMARGEPLLNENLLERWDYITTKLRDLAQMVGVQDVRFNISTIMPTSDGTAHAGRAVEEVLCTAEDWQHPTIYYSLYSLNHEFRKRWLPKAMEPEEALNQLTLIQRFMGLKLVIHHCLIEGENDSIEDAKAIADAMELYRLRARFNLVRYNPYSPAQGKEPPEDVFVAYFQAITKGMKVPGSRIVPRVGFDVKASCGMFVQQG
jgi:23S rRNA (adenine2503-C2)-methyltransferase